MNTAITRIGASAARRETPADSARFAGIWALEQNECPIPSASLLRVPRPASPPTTRPAPSRFHFAETSKPATITASSIAGASVSSSQGCNQRNAHRRPCSRSRCATSAVSARVPPTTSLASSCSLRCGLSVSDAGASFLVVCFAYHSQARLASAWSFHTASTHSRAAVATPSSVRILLPSRSRSSIAVRARNTAARSFVSTARTPDSQSRAASPGKDSVVSYSSAPTTSVGSESPCSPVRSSLVIAPITASRTARRSLYAASRAALIVTAERAGTAGRMGSGPRARSNGGRVARIPRRCPSLSAISASSTRDSPICRRSISSLRSGLPSASSR